MGGIISKDPVDAASQHIKDVFDAHVNEEKTDAELAVLAKYASIAQRNISIGLIAGSLIPYGVWRASGASSRLAGTTLILSGGLAGVLIGIIPMRHDLLLELLTLPPDESRFAIKARKVLHEKIPENEFVKEIDDRMLQIGAIRNMQDYKSLKGATWDTNSLPTLMDIQDEVITDKSEMIDPFFMDIYESKDTDLKLNDLDHSKDDEVSPFDFINTYDENDECHNKDNEPKVTSWDEIRRKEH